VNVEFTGGGRIELFYVSGSVNDTALLGSEVANVDAGVDGGLAVDFAAGARAAVSVDEWALNVVVDVNCNGTVVSVLGLLRVISRGIAFDELAAASTGRAHLIELNTVSNAIDVVAIGDDVAVATRIVVG